MRGLGSPSGPRAEKAITAPTHRTESSSPEPRDQDRELSAQQFHLAAPLQGTIDGRWEPTSEAVASQPPAALPASTVRQGSLLAPKQHSLSKYAVAASGGPRKKESYPGHGNPWGDPEADPAGTTIGAKLDLIARLEGYRTRLDRPALERDQLLRFHSRDRLLVRPEWEWLECDIDTAVEEQRRVDRIIEKLRQCGTTAVPAGGPHIAVREASSGARHLSGVCHCAKTLCPSCGHWNARQRRERLTAAIPTVAPLGRHFHAVFTLRHRMGVKWKSLANTQRAVWNKMVQRRQWKESVLGYVRVPEALYTTRNGWHQHIHVLITLDNKVDPAWFSDWMEEFWRVEARKLGRTADWSKQQKWFTEIAVEKLKSVLCYQTKGAGDDYRTEVQESWSTDTHDLEKVAMAEVLGGVDKLGSRPWDLPMPQFVELWFDSKRFRWFSVGGCWKTKAVAAVEKDEAASELREKSGDTIATATKENWRLLTLDSKMWLHCIVKNKSLDRVAFLERWDWFWRGWCRAHERPDTEADARLEGRRAALVDRVLHYLSAGPTQPELFGHRRIAGVGESRIAPPPEAPRPRSFDGYFGPHAVVHRVSGDRPLWAVSLVDERDGLTMPITESHRCESDAVTEALDWHDFERAKLAAQTTIAKGEPPWTATT